MKTFIFYLGKTLQLLGIGTVLIAFVGFFSNASMGVLLKITFTGMAEFYLGSYMVSKTGINKKEKRGM